MGKTARHLYCPPDTRKSAVLPFSIVSEVPLYKNLRKVKWVNIGGKKEQTDLYAYRSRKVKNKTKKTTKNERLITRIRQSCLGK